MASFSNIFAEGQSHTRPPLFDGTSYSTWKNRMQEFLISIHCDLWTIILEGPFIPMKDIKGEKVTKEWKELTSADKYLVSMNSKAKNILSCALTINEYNRVCSCSTAKDMWEMLQVTHEGTSQVKEQRINILVHQYEMFNMEQEESISQMYGRFMEIINPLTALGKIYSQSEQVKKILRSLPREWTPKVTAIQEAKDLNNMSIAELIGSLTSHELTILAKDEVKLNKEKSVAFKSNTMQDDDNDLEDLDEDEKNEEIARITRRINQLLNYNRNSSQNSPRNLRKSSKFESEIKCYQCQNSGHIKPNCPLLNKCERFQRMSKHKGLSTTWDDQEFEGDMTDEEIANVCLMTNEETIGMK
ncbi:PREDICTED: uncharacterized protein LOC105964724 [Erythranthe guttata]|uniref:uncharacterized protein LOC105964724 n=1 Tax=Erythranthe guttata TaxID=4155 RepID=UPI00064D917B|nr:PREDICTED: uncharacterized protein LOC105964724 [Erythranthe guttata]|eukprot:XP_012844683.1 PREDICTED: uncharacterized protein LOC105964724 [Erythranthe guttata]